MALAAAASLAAASIVLPQIPRSLEGWPDYGIHWQHRPKGWRTLVNGSAGYNVRVRRGVIHLEIRARPSAGATTDTVVEVRVGQRPAGREVLRIGEIAGSSSTHWPARTMAFVELRASSEDSGEPRDLLLIARRPR